MFKITKSIDSNSNNNNPSILFNYYPTIIENNHLRKDDIDNTVLSATFIGKVNEPNINYTDDITQTSFYQSKNLYVYGKIHKISGLEHDAEVIIEHIPITNGTKKLFSCFLLKYSRNKSVVNSSISNLITNTNNINPLYISFNEYITKDDTTIVYDTITNYNDPCTIIIFTKVIYIRDDNNIPSFSITEITKLFSPSLITNISVAKCNCLNKNNTIEGFGQTTISDKNVLTVEGDGNDIFTCEYLPVSTDTVDVFQIPIDTSLIKNVSNLEFTNTAIYIFISIIITLILFFVTPKLYDMYWLADYKKSLPTIITNYTDILVKNMNSFDFTISTTFIFISVILFIVGFSIDNNMALISSCLLFFMFIIGYFSIYINNLLKPKKNNIGGLPKIIPEQLQPSNNDININEPESV